LRCSWIAPGCGTKIYKFFLPNFFGLLSAQKSKMLSSDILGYTDWLIQTLCQFVNCTIKEPWMLAQKRVFPAFAQTRVAEKMHALFWSYNYAVVCALVSGLARGARPLIAQMHQRDFRRRENLRKTSRSHTKGRLKFSFISLT
jgi:hypothetical protein